MAAITKIEAYVLTASETEGGTDSYVYLGLGGREFALDSTADDFQKGATQTFVLGADGNVLNPATNDPRRPQLDTGELQLFPAYLRIEPSGAEPDWCLERAIVTVNPGQDSRATYDFLSLAGTEGHQKIWLGANHGTFLHLKRI
jgi:hypothetical protein